MRCVHESRCIDSFRKSFVESTTLDVLRDMCGKETLRRLSLRAGTFRVLDFSSKVMSPCVVSRNRVATRQSILLCIRAHTDLPVVAELAAQLLHIISDNNPMFTQQIRTSAPEQELKTLIKRRSKTTLQHRSRKRNANSSSHCWYVFQHITIESHVSKCSSETCFGLCSDLTPFESERSNQGMRKVSSQQSVKTME